MTKTSAQILPTGIHAEHARPVVELLCPVNNLVSLRAVVDNGANGVRIDWRARPEGNGLVWFDGKHNALMKGIHYAHDRGCKVTVGIMQESASTTDWMQMRALLKHIADEAADAVVLSEPALMFYAANHHPTLQLHYAIPAASLHPESVEIFQRQLGISRVILPRVVSLSQVRQIIRRTSVEVEIAGFGPLCSIVDGNAPEEEPDCDLELLCLANQPLSSGRCATSDDASNDDYFPHAALPNTNALRLLPQLLALGVHALKIEAARAIPGRRLAQITRVWREAIDCCLENPTNYAVRQSWITDLGRTARSAAFN